MINVKYNNKTIQQKRKAVREGLFKNSENIKSGKIKSISHRDLRVLYEFYEEIFFDNWFRDNYKGQIRFDLSRRMTKSAGLTKCPKNVSELEPEQILITICIGVDFFFKYDHLEGSKNVCGIKTTDSLEALQIVFEHEMVHALEFILFHNSNCGKERFKNTVHNLFGHTESHHEIPTNKIIAREKLGINIGDKIEFAFEDKALVGYITNINKRATVMVENPHGIYLDSSGKKYMKYYVPLSCIKKIIG